MQKSIGRTFGELTVIDRNKPYIGRGSGRESSKNCKYLCRCPNGHEDWYWCSQVWRGNCRKCSEEWRKVRESSAYRYWKANVQYNCCPKWEDFWQWHADCGDPKGRNIIRSDVSQPHSPENSRWSRNTEIVEWRIKEAVDALVARGESRTRAEHRARRVSRQRIHQIRNERKA